MSKLTAGPYPSLTLPSKLQGKTTFELNVSGQILLGEGFPQGHRVVGEIFAQLLPVGHPPLL